MTDNVNEAGAANAGPENASVVGNDGHSSDTGGRPSIVHINQLLCEDPPPDPKAVTKLVKDMRKTGERLVVDVRRSDNDEKPFVVVGQGIVRLYAYQKMRAEQVPVRPMKPADEAAVVECIQKMKAPAPSIVDEMPEVPASLKRKPGDTKVALPAKASEIIMPSKVEMPVEELAEIAERIRARIRRSSADVIAIGEELMIVQQRLDPERFEIWVESELGPTLRWAQLQMQVARFADGRNEIISLVPPTFLYRLSAPSTPPAIQHEVVAALEAGKPVDYVQVERRIKECRARERETKPSKPASKPKKPETISAAVTIIPADPDEPKTVTVHVGTDTTVMTNAEAAREPLETDETDDTYVGRDLEWDAACEKLEEMQKIADAAMDALRQLQPEELQLVANAAADERSWNLLRQRIGALAISRRVH